MMYDEFLGNTTLEAVMFDKNTMNENSNISSTITNSTTESSTTNKGLSGGTIAMIVSGSITIALIGCIMLCKCYVEDYQHRNMEDYLPL